MELFETEKRTREIAENTVQSMSFLIKRLAKRNEIWRIAMRLSLGDQKNVIGKIESKRSNGTCMVCRQHEWSIATNVFMLLEYDPKLKIPQDSLTNLVYYPFIILVCKNCGNTLLFASHKLGITEEQKETTIP